MTNKQLIFLIAFLFVLFGYIVPYLQYKNFNPPKNSTARPPTIRKSNDFSLPKPSAKVKRPMPKESKKKKELNIIYMEEKYGE